MRPTHAERIKKGHSPTRCGFIRSCLDDERETWDFQTSVPVDSELQTPKVSGSSFLRYLTRLAKKALHLSFSNPGEAQQLMVRHRDGLKLFSLHYENEGKTANRLKKIEGDVARIATAVEQITTSRHNSKAHIAELLLFYIQQPGNITECFQCVADASLTLLTYINYHKVPLLVRPTLPISTYLAQALTNAVCNFWQRPYKKAQVLCVHFERDRQSGNLGSSSDRIRDIFLKTYGYDSVSFMMKDGDLDPEASLASALNELLADMDEECLAVLHYIGQGETVLNTSRNRDELHLRKSYSWTGHTIAFKNPMADLRDSMIDFNRLREEILDPTPSNVLILLDCCHAATGSMGQRELIAACSFESQCVAGPGGFTSNLVQQLEHANNQGQILSTSQLYSRLATKNFIMQGGQPELAAMPIFLQHHVTPLFLMPTLLGTHLSWHPALTRNIQTLGAMQGWMGSRPYQVDQARVDKVYKPSSILVVFAITFLLWHSLTPSPAITFIGFECQDTPPYQ
ncbi:hypothetical protein FGADI_3520 [Fusarium gaditjirri]|uniref:Uncharacterized protein n=1 Tax=Fusarium gaditjirri TaxID=282569 RepID=A0A8H4TFH4_9HYPO|nr:hypothetical protein FGADI_3520 [Fusarium gaditjirri]